jgi:hypothetical protein
MLEPKETTAQPLSSHEYFHQSGHHLRHVQLSDKQGSENPPILPYSNNISINKTYKIETTRPVEDRVFLGQNNLHENGADTTTVSKGMPNTTVTTGITSSSTTTTTTTTTRSKGSSSRSSSNSNSILPPLPSIPKPTRKICTGPNPYSLTKKSNTFLTDGSNQSSFRPPTLSTNVVVGMVSDENYRVYSMPTGVIEPPKYNHNDTPMSGNIITPTWNTTNNSLFAISPRSFLTGPTTKNF